MSELPSYFQYLKSQGKNSNLYPFAYSQEAREFSIGDKEIELVDFDPYKFNPNELNLSEGGIPVDEILDHPALIPNFGAVIVGPKLHTWAEEHPSEVSEAYIVMHAALTAFLEDPSSIPLERSFSHMGFASGLREGGGIHLQVFGDCACMGPDPHGHFIHGQFEHGFASYDLHNADTQSQRASLYAGLGHLANFAAAESLK